MADEEHIWVLAIGGLVFLLCLFTTIFALLHSDHKGSTWCGAVRASPDKYGDAVFDVKVVRRFGAQPPWHARQIIAALLFFIDAVIFYGVVVHSVTSGFRNTGVNGTISLEWTFLWVIHGMAGAGFWGLYFYLQFMDPSAHSYTSQELTTEAANETAICLPCCGEDERSPLVPASDPALRKAHAPRKRPWYYCSKCAANSQGGYITGRHRRHCWRCRRCTTGYDHHCVYLNQCICAANYIPWCWFVTCLAVQAITQVVVSVACVVDVSNNDTPNSIAKWGKYTLMVLGCLLIVIATGAAIFAVDLLRYHARLKIIQHREKKFYTTYVDYGRSFEDGIEAERTEINLWRLLQGAACIEDGPVQYLTRGDPTNPGKYPDGPVWLELPPGPEREAQKKKIKAHRKGEPEPAEVVEETHNVGASEEGAAEEAASEEGAAEEATPQETSKATAPQDVGTQDKTSPPLPTSPRSNKDLLHTFESSRSVRFSKEDEHDKSERTGTSLNVSLQKDVLLAWIAWKIHKKEDEFKASEMARNNSQQKAMDAVNTGQCWTYMHWIWGQEPEMEVSE